MTDEHTPTQQEQDLYDALNQGDTDTIEQIRNDALGIAPLEEEAEAGGPSAPATLDTEQPEEPPVELGPEQQFELDYQNAHARYQADHEAPEDERERLTAEAVQRDNHQAMEGI